MDKHYHKTTMNKLCEILNWFYNNFNKSCTMRIKYYSKRCSLKIFDYDNQKIEVYLFGEHKAILSEWDTKMYDKEYIKKYFNKIN